ncbi:MAG: protein kinase domain-containing protein, partial [Pseudonocardiaceae bacterium]
MSAGALIADRYRLLGELPAVPPRVLWQARDEWSGQLLCATRVSMAGLSEQEILLARYSLSREVRAVEGFQHRHVVLPTDAVLDADDLWVVSESMPETTLAGVLVQHGRVGPEQAARWGRDIADALAAAHGAGMLHRDLHAAVVGLADDGAAVVGGFAATALTSVGLGAGVPLHVAPEVAQGEPASPATDVFALAAMLYTAVEGRGPYPAA